MLTAIVLAAMSATLSIPADPIGDPNAGPVLDRNGNALPPPPRFTEVFTKGSNEGEWSWGGGFQSIQAKGGNPKWYLRTDSNDTYAPQVATAFGIDSEFTGNIREKRIYCYGADFITEHVDFSAAERPMSILLTSDPGTPEDPLDDCTVYTSAFGAPFGASFAPEPGDGWRHYEFFLVRPNSPPVLPSGWHVLEGCTEPTPDDAWNRVVQDVDEVRFFYGDPTDFFIFQNFTVGVDNIFAELFSENPR